MACLCRPERPEHYVLVQKFPNQDTKEVLARFDNADVAYATLEYVRTISESLAATMKKEPYSVAIFATKPLPRIECAYHAWLSSGVEGAKQWLEGKVVVEPTKEACNNSKHEPECKCEAFEQCDGRGKCGGPAYGFGKNQRCEHAEQLAYRYSQELEPEDLVEAARFMRDFGHQTYHKAKPKWGVRWNDVKDEASRAERAVKVTKVDGEVEYRGPRGGVSRDTMYAVAPQEFLVERRKHGYSAGAENLRRWRERNKE